MSVTLHILEGDPMVRPWAQKLDKLSREAISWVENLLPIKNVDVVVCRYRFFALEETGIGGYSVSENLAFIAVEPENENFERSFETQVPATIAHELNHCVRRTGPGYGKTLREAIVSEGLALHFETKILKGIPPFYALAVAGEKLTTLRERALSELDDKLYSHDNWFYGSKEHDIPRHTGYSMGYQVVKEFLETTGKDICSIWNEPATSFTI